MDSSEFLKLQYESITPITNFKLQWLEKERIFGNRIDGVYENIKDVPTGVSLYFLHIKNVDLSNMRFPVYYHKSIESLQIKFYSITFNSTGNLIGHYPNDKPIIINVGDHFLGYEHFCNFINKYIIEYVRSCATNSKILKKKYYLYGTFDVMDGKLTYNYQKNIFDSTNKDDINFYLLGFNYDLYSLIGKYFTTECIESNNGECIYYISPSMIYSEFEKRALIEGKDGIHTITNVEACNIQDEFFHPTQIFNFIIGNEMNNIVKIPFTPNKKIIEIDKYILFSKVIKKTSGEVTQTPTRITSNIDYPTKSIEKEKISIDISAEYIRLNDKYDQMNLFNIVIGRLYTAEEYHELSYKKLTGITATNVYLQNQTSTEKLESINALVTSNLKQEKDILDTLNEFKSSFSKQIKNRGSNTFTDIIYAIYDGIGKFYLLFKKHFPGEISKLTDIDTDNEKITPLYKLLEKQFPYNEEETIQSKIDDVKENIKEINDKQIKDDFLSLVDKIFPKFETIEEKIKELSEEQIKDEFSEFLKIFKANFNEKGDIYKIVNDFLEAYKEGNPKITDLLKEIRKSLNTEGDTGNLLQIYQLLRQYFCTSNIGPPIKKKSKIEF